jgi:hypothetical protein
MTDRGIRPSPSVTVDRYFLDESGHGGDLASAKNLDFAGQPFFALVCVGAADAALLAAELDRLRVFYACGEGELKSAKLGKKLAPISQELITFLVRQRWPLFVELVDKRFFIAAHVVNHLLCGHGGPQYDRRIPLGRGFRRSAARLRQRLRYALGYVRGGGHRSALALAGSF